MNKELQDAITTLSVGGIILYPTDTVWGIGCDATDPEAVKRIYELKKRPHTEPMICLVSDIRMLDAYVEDIPDAAFDIIAFSTKPTTIVYDGAVNVAPNLIAPDGSIGIRVVHDDFCRNLSKEFGKPILSTSANRSGETTPANFEEISDEILKGVDYVVNLHHDRRNRQLSAIVKVTKEGQTKMIRE